VSGGVLSGFVLGADRRVRFVLVVLVQVVALIEVWVGDRGGARWLRHREGAGG
jgi:hypothetical protein